MFADVTTHIFEINNETQKLEEKYQNVEHWLQANKMSLSTAKTSYI